MAKTKVVQPLQLLKSTSFHLLFNLQYVNLLQLQVHRSVKYIKKNNEHVPPNSDLYNRIFNQ